MHEFKTLSDMKNGYFIVRDLLMFENWNWDHWFEVPQKYDFINDILPILEEYEPIIVYMDGFIEGTKDNSCVCLRDVLDLPYPVQEFVELWIRYGYPDEPPEFWDW